MAKKTIVDLFDDFEEFIEDCKAQAFSSNKIIVPRDEVLNMIREIKMKIPSEVEHSNKVVENRDAILTEARKKADEIILAAQNEAQRRVNDSEVMRLATEQARELMMQANAKAQEIVNEAAQQGDAIRMGALNYTNNVMLDLSDFTARFLEEESAKYQILVQTLQNHYQTIETNREQIEAQLDSGVAPKGDGKKSVTNPPKRQLSEVEKVHKETRTTSSATPQSASRPAPKPEPVKKEVPKTSDIPVDDELDELDELYLDQY
ncbi:MAG: hypothetical protein PUC39_00125 [Lachnospiraceae bacterium]|nr:hypothetical protein [Lachnospiraceae bacterium]